MRSGRRAARDDRSWDENYIGPAPAQSDHAKPVYPPGSRTRPRKRNVDKADRRKRLEHLWVAITLAWGFARVVVVWGTLRRYGVNPWVYAAIEVITSGPYGVATARTVTSLLDHKKQAASRWGALGLALFLAPDLYIVAAGREMPAFIYVVLGVLVATLGTLAFLSVRAKVTHGRLARQLVSAKSAAGDSS